jgi:H+/Cl- antiporter ClcA
VGAALFALEILHRRGLQYYEALVPSLVGALVGYSINFALTGVGLAPVWHLPDAGRLHGGDLVWGLVCGLLGGAGALIFAGAVTTMRHATSRIPAGVLPVVGGVALAALSFWSPYALTNGETQVDHVASGKLGLAALGVAMAAKLAGVLVTLTGRWKGGFIIPLFFIGMAGGQLVHELIPHSNATVLMVGLAVALCVGVTKTPLGSTLVVTQMAGLAVLPMALTAAIVALLLTGEANVIETQRARAQRPEGDHEAPQGGQHP